MEAPTAARLIDHSAARIIVTFFGVLVVVAAVGAARIVMRTFVSHGGKHEDHPS